MNIDHRHYPRTLSAILFCIWLVLARSPASAQCADPGCDVPDTAGPSIVINPTGETYLFDEGTTHSVTYTATLFDRSGLDDSSYNFFTDGAELGNSTRESFADGTHWTVTGQIHLRRLGDNVLTIRARDVHGNERTATATFRVAFTDPGLPLVYTDAHHDQYRDTNASQLTLAYTTPAYVSLDTPRSVSLVYRSELASPNAYVQVDAKPDPRTAANVKAMSLQVIGSDGRVVGREYFWAKLPAGEKQRMAVFWSMRARATGAYNYTVAVRSYFNDGTFKEKRVTARVLIVNESASRYGAGWTIGGIPRIYGATGGVILHEGDGRLRWYGSIPCTPSFCTFERPEGDFTELTYDRTAGVWTRIHPDNSVTKFDSRGLITTSTDPHGRSTAFAWQNTADAAAVPVLASISDPVQKTTTFTYTAAGFLQKVTDPAGRELSLTINASGDLVALSGQTAMQVAYTTTHLPTSFTDENGTWDTFFYRGTFSAMYAPTITAEGRQLRPWTKYQRAEWKTTLLATQGTGLEQLAPAVEPSKASEEIVDARDHKVSVTRNRYGQPLAISDLTEGVSSFTYTTSGLRTAEIDPDGMKTEYDWNGRGQLIARRVHGFPDYQAVYESRTDHPDYIVTAGRTQWYSWGSRGQLVHSWYGERADYERNGTTYEYDALYRRTGLTGPKGERREWTYGDWGNVASVREILADGTSSTTSFTYDSAGRQHTTTNPLSQQTITVYDSRNRVREITDALSRVTKIDYSGERVSRVTDPAGKVFGFTYNALGWLESETFPDGVQPRTYTYDADGLLLSKKDRREAPVHYTYDSAHRTLTRTADNAVTTYSYPDRNTFVATNAEGTYTKKMSPSFGQLESLRTTLAGLPGRAWELKLALDPEDPLNPVGNDLNFYLNDVLQRTATFRYQSIPQPEGSELLLTDPYGGTTSLTYDGSGNHVRTVYPNGAVHNHSIASDGRHNSSSFSNSSLNQALGVAYAYDRIDRVKERTNSLGNIKWGYKYTFAGALESYLHSAALPPVGCNPRIQTCNPTWSTLRSAAYTYDDAGNRTDSGSVVAANSNRYTSFAGYTLEYDLEGNLTRKSKAGFDQQLAWNSLGQLASVTTNGDVLTFGYDAMGRRVRRTAGGTSRYYVYEDEDLLLELGADGAPIREYVHLPGTDQPLSVRENIPGGQLVHYYVLERPGHVRAILDQNGAVAGEYAYTPFGEAIATGKGDGTAQPLRFMARELDAGIRLYYVRNRWYDPELGRFISEDPIGLSGGLNTYAYRNNEPINGRDPSGLSPYSDPDPIYRLDELVGVACRFGLCNWWEDEIFERWRMERMAQDAYDPGNPRIVPCTVSTCPPSAPLIQRPSEAENRAAARARNEAYRQCAASANSSSWAQDVWHETKMGVSFIPISVGIGALVGNAVPVVGTAAGAAGGLVVGTVKVGAQAVWNATINRAGNRNNQCGGYFSSGF